MSYEDATATLDHETREAIDIDRSKGDFTFPERHKFDAGRGLSEKTVDYICDVKNDPQWVREFRHKAYSATTPLELYQLFRDADA